jgi:hypothetical protein
MKHAMVTPEQNATLQVALDKHLGITHELKFEKGRNGMVRVTQGARLPADVGPVKSLQEAYVAYSGDYNLSQFGNRVTQVFNDVTFENALANSLNKLLLQDYTDNYRWADIVTSFTSVKDFRPAHRIRVRHVDDLPEISEDGVYEEATVAGDEDLSYSIIQKGARLTITRRALINDDVAGISRTASQLGRAAWRTLAKQVWGKVINNDVYGVDGKNMFHADHGNLGSAALSPAALTTARAAIFAQTEPGSTERLGLSGPFMLAIPVELEPTAIPINTSRIAPGTATDANPWFERFGENSERIFSNPLFTNANDWYLFDLSQRAGIIEVGYLSGKQSPQIILANSEIEGQKFSQDRTEYKIRFEFQAAIDDFRAAYKSVPV